MLNAACLMVMLAAAYAAVPQPPATADLHFRSSYVLHYTAEGVAEGGWHDLVVSVKRRGNFEIRARKGYMGRARIAAPGGHR